MRPTALGLALLAGAGLAASAAVWALDAPIWLLVVVPIAAAVVEIVVSSRRARGDARTSARAKAPA